MTTRSPRFWPVTDVGRVRTGNEDAFLVDEALRLFVVADGMGGHAAGEVASNLAVHVFRDTLHAERARIQRFERGLDPKARIEMVELLDLAVQNACAAVNAEAERDPAKRGMGTTLVALLLVGTRGFITHVGDSRAYLCRGDAVHQLTQDHSLLNELMRRGRLQSADLASAPIKNAVTRAIGVYESVQGDTLDFDVLAGDRYLLCTDGLTEYLDEAKLIEIFQERPIESVSQALVDHANASGGKDNITTIVLAVPDASTGVDRLASRVNLQIETLQSMQMFQHLSYQELVRVLNIVDVREYAAGQTIVTEGEQGEEMFIVLDGHVSVHSGGTSLAKFGPGQHFGEMALVDQAARSASVTSDGASTLMVIHRAAFFDIVRREHDIAVKVLWSFLGALSQRLRKTSRELGDARTGIAATTVPQRPKG